GEYPEAAAVMLFYQTGELFQSLAVGRSRRSIAALMDIRPETAVVEREGKELSVSPEEVALGEILVVRPGEKIALDGSIIDGRTSVNTSALTGESLPADKAEGERVISGSINLSGLIRVRTESLYSESTVAKILELVENSSEKKARAENFITRFARWYTPCVVIAALLLALLPPLLFAQGFEAWLRRALVFLVVSCPCALVISVPLSFFGGIGGASREGILIKGANYLETLASAGTVVLDKTGTLTKGSFTVNAVHPEEISESELLDIAAAAESCSTHPVAESIIRAHGGHIDKERLGEISEKAGMGLRAEVDGRVFYIGSAALMTEAGVKWHECSLAGTIVHVSEGSEYLGHIVINDEIKSGAKRALAALKGLGVSKTVMLTGDSERVAETVAHETGLDEYRAGLLPAGKVEAVEELLAEGRTLAFVGDGINDAPALSRADVGIAMGALGSDAAIEAADIVLMDDNIEKLPLALKISRRTMRIVRENIAFALLVKAAVLILGALGAVGMWAAVFGDVGVTVIAILNAMRCMGKIK
ncbi:MAG: heavy metal translocating P-type ATPase, partial [Oscillospiraceae bacterium]|nr:heavy metal translocating P-type ATPase [Oscillospiraceae bacterium]